MKKKYSRVDAVGGGNPGHITYGIIATKRGHHGKKWHEINGLTRKQTEQLVSDLLDVLALFTDDE